MCPGPDRPHGILLFTLAGDDHHFCETIHREQDGQDGEAFIGTAGAGRQP